MDANESRSVGPRAYATGFVTLLIAWFLLAGGLGGGEWLVGLWVALVVTAISGPHLAILNGLKLTANAPLGVLKFLFVFFVALVRANFDLARRVLTPSLPLNPAVVEVETALRSDLGRLLLANSITLTPGTLSVDLNGNRILVHWVDATPGVDLEATTNAIARDFEQHLREFVA